MRRFETAGNGADLFRPDARPQRAAVAQRDTPLWFYILRESEFERRQAARGVGGPHRRGDLPPRDPRAARFSIVRDPGFRPSLGPNNTTFRMVDLLVFAFRGRRNLLAPLG